MIKMEFVQTAPTGGDCTAPYDVFLDQECTLEQFIEKVLTRGEWGKIYVDRFGVVEYRHDEITKNDLDKTIMSRLVGRIRAAGGWSNMNYHLDLKSTVFIKQDELAKLSWEIAQILYKCDNQREAFNLIIATTGTLIASWYKNKNEQVAALKFVRRRLDNFIKNVEKGELQ